MLRQRSNTSVVPSSPVARVQSTSRALGYAGEGGLTLYSRNDRDISRSYPEITALEIDQGVVVDGELVALDQHGRPDFGQLQHRMHITAPSAELIGRVLVQYVVFDLLRSGGRSLLELPYGRRRELLDRLGLERPCQVPEPGHGV
jgi:bifunctional non-homologous end joining protein LigD